MVVHYITSAKHMHGKEINLLRDQPGLKRGYEIFEKEGIIKQFYCDNGYAGNLNCWEVPEGARTMEFMKKTLDVILSPYDKSGLEEDLGAGAPIYRDKRGNIIKIGNH